MKNLSSLFKKDNLNRRIFNILTPHLEEAVDSRNTFFEDGGVQDIYGILYFHYIELTLIIEPPIIYKFKILLLFLQSE